VREKQEKHTFSFVLSSERFLQHGQSCEIIFDFERQIVIYFVPLPTIWEKLSLQA
jgi:hypothetical protein